MLVLNKWKFFCVYVIYIFIRIYFLNFYCDDIKIGNFVFVIDNLYKNRIDIYVFGFIVE